MPKQKAKSAGRRKPAPTASAESVTPTDALTERGLKSKPSRKRKAGASLKIAQPPQDPSSESTASTKKKPSAAQTSRRKVQNAASKPSLLGTLMSRVGRQPNVPAESDRLQRLERAVSDVREGTHTSPRTRKLLASGVPKMAQKVIEEAAEVAIEAIRADKKALIHESVDLFYNLTVLWSGAGVSLAEIWTEMDRRESTLGMAEKLPKILDDE